MITMDTYNCEKIDKILKEARKDKPIEDHIGRNGLVNLYAHIFMCDRCKRKVYEHVRKYY